MNELPEELKAIAPNVYWDQKRDTVYVRAQGVASSDLSGYIHRFRQVLNDSPDNVGIRFLLATYLQMSGQHQEARAELEQVAASTDTVWAAKAHEILSPKSELPAV